MADDTRPISSSGLNAGALREGLARLSGRAQQAMQERVAQAGQMTQGPFHQPGGIDQAAGGASGLASPMAWVSDPQAPIFQYLSRYYPKVAAALDRIPNEITFTEGPVAGGHRGLTETSGWAGKSLYRNPINITIDPARAAGTTYPHEALHALYLAKEAAAGTAPSLARLASEMGQPSQEMAMRILATMEDPIQFQALTKQYGPDVGHAAVAKIAGDLYRKAHRPPLP